MDQENQFETVDPEAANAPEPSGAEPPRDSVDALARLASDTWHRNTLAASRDHERWRLVVRALLDEITRPWP